MSSNHSGGARDNNFNLLRFVAASLVLMSHSFALSTGSPMTEPLRESLGVTWGSIAVDVFFVTSGYLVSGSLLARESLIAFAAARFLRIYPGLWLALGITVLVSGACITTLHAVDFFLNGDTWKYLFKNATVLNYSYRWTLPGVFENNPLPKAVNGSLWTLPLEVKMYFSLAVIWVLSKRLPGIAAKNFSKLCCLVAILCMAANLVIILGEVQQQYIAFGYMFFSGAALRMLQNRIPVAFRFAGPMLLAILVSAANKMVFNIVYVLCIPYVVMYLALVPKGKIRSFNRFGDYSYGIYIYAFPVQQMFAFFWHGINPYEMMISSFLVTLCLAIASWKLVEKRALAYKRVFETIGTRSFLQKT